MDHIEKYVIEQNIKLFMNLLEQEPDSDHRSRITNLLLAEVGRFGKISEQLDCAERALQKCSQKINDQRDQINSMRGDHPHLAMAKYILANMLDIRSVMKSHRDLLRDMLH